MLLTVLSSAPLSAQMPESLSRLFGRPSAIGINEDLAKPISHGVFADGSIAIADYARFDVTSLSARGALKWRSGRKGSGPGEFQLPYRLVVLPDQTLIVYDPGTTRFSRLSATGKYVESLVSDIKIRIDQMAALPTGEVLVLGNTEDPRGKSAALHVLNARLQHIRSFGRLPEMRDPRTLSSFGTGGVSISSTGLIVHTRFFPYEISEYSADGIEVSRRKVAAEVTRPEDYVRIDSLDGRITRTVNPQMTRPIPVRRLNDRLLLGGHIKGGIRSFDLIDSQGRITATGEMPKGWEGVVQIDYRHRRFIVAGEAEDVPVVWIVPFGPGLGASQ